MDNIDAMASKFASHSLYNYALNRPLNIIDPDGNESRDIWGNTTFNGFVGDDGNGNFVGSTGGGGDDKEKGKKKEDGKKKEPAKTEKCETCLNPASIGENILGLSYPGGNNPRSFNGAYSYEYVPSNIAEYPAIGHDRRYDNLGTKGLIGLLSDTRAIGADWKFVKEELESAMMPAVSPKERIEAFTLGVGLGILATPKTIYKMSSKLGIADILVNYQLSSIGVTNKPSKKIK